MQVEPPTLVARRADDLARADPGLRARARRASPGAGSCRAGMRSLVGGAAVPEALIRAFAGTASGSCQGWGMTETSPLATVSYPRAELQALGDDERFRARRWPACRCRWSTCASAATTATTRRGTARAWARSRCAGRSSPAAYHGVPVADDKFTADGWLRTGDVATMDELGFVRITDRTKDLIKSGGEWISSVDLENALMAHPAIAEAAVIAIPDPKWGERPLACIVWKPGAALEPASVAERARRASARARLRQVAAARSLRGDRRRAAHLDRQVLEAEAARALPALTSCLPDVTARDCASVPLLRSPWPHSISSPPNPTPTPSPSPNTPSAPTSSTRSSVVKGRALPDVSDGQKPVQRRILYAMARMGLAFTTAAGPKAVKSARVVGDVLGRFHPHGDQAAYDALVRMAQDFSLRYPLIDGQGNFGSRDGDGAAAMRYTEARLAPIARLLLDEIDEGTVDFIANYDGSTEEPRLLPARLPFVLLNGASGIAVGLATEIPSHNLREVAARGGRADQERQARPTTSSPRCCPGPDYPGRRPDHQRRRGDPRRLRHRPRLAQGARALEDRGPGARPVAARRHRAAAGHERAEGAGGDRGAHQPEGHAPARRRSAPSSCSSRRRVLAVLDAVRDESSKDARGAPGVRAARRSRIDRRTSCSTRCSRTPASRARRRST